MQRLFPLFVWLAVCGLCYCQEKSYEDRWFYASFGLRSDQEADELTDLIRLASQKKLNGMLWACGLERCSRWGNTTKTRFDRIREVADEQGIEIIPLLWSVGYGTMLGRDPNLVEAIRADKVAFRVKNGKAEFVPDEKPQCSNPSMEEYKQNRLTGWMQDSPGVISFVDTQVKRTGNASIRFENYSENKHGHGRLSRILKIKPNKQYCLSIWYKTERLRGGSFMFQLYREDGQQITSNRVKVGQEGNRDWTKISLFFNSADGFVRFFCGLWGGKEGKVWFDDFSIEELGLVSPVRRPGTPLVVSDAKTGTVYTEGKDFVLPPFKLNIWRPDTKSLALDIPKGSALTDGTDLFVSYYHPAYLGDDQRTVCMSEPKLYDGFRDSARDVMKMLAPKKWFLSMDEIRAGGSCEACKSRGISLAAILGDCITKQYQIIREVQPDATVYIWSDMLDPNHNCRDKYVLCEGDYTGAWNYVPKNLVIDCWYHQRREKSMKFFSEKGFRTQAGAYYDAATIDSCAEWLETCNKTKGCTGIMYTTWQKKYALLPAFGDLLLEKSHPFGK